MKYVTVLLAFVPISIVGSLLHWDDRSKVLQELKIQQAILVSSPQQARLAGAGAACLLAAGGEEISVSVAIAPERASPVCAPL